MTKRQYLVQHILHLCAKLSTIQDPKEKANVEQALLFFSRELKEYDAKSNMPPYTQ